jgi:peroxiredoxin
VASKSDWGIDKHSLQIGEPAADFSLPKAFDPPIGLSNYLGQKYVIVTTYRAHW